MQLTYAPAASARKAKPGSARRAADTERRDGRRDAPADAERFLRDSFLRA
ncbi:hypothetical protein C7S16_5270 [Burkholderia thailandensis]|uniref:Uncharacterized protein n=1 Tax=Burkholderia thailandensis TaxID=57975 RepID=A0AAW9CRQ5_BURTH|nr:hypothetical protein [Burkholderia thailandensis]MDW9253289.1 hypothetical protein [Burkholderia thailandensis]